MIPKLFLFLCFLALVIPAAMADLPPWGEVNPDTAEYHLDIWGPDTYAHRGVVVLIEGTITDEDGNPMSKESLHHPDIYYVNVFVDSGNGYENTDYMYPDKDYNMANGYKIMTKNITSYYISYTNPDSSITYTSNIYTVHPRPQQEPDVSGLYVYIGYAKGFFAFLWFAVLFTTIGMGAYSAQCNDPTKRERAIGNLFDLVKLLFTVTVFYLVMIFLRSSS